MKTWQWLTLGFITAVTVGLQLYGPQLEHPHAWDAIPGFYGMFGFVSCVLIVVVSKLLGKWLLQRREDYYDE